MRSERGFNLRQERIRDILRWSNCGHVGRKRYTQGVIYLGGTLYFLPNSSSSYSPMHCTLAAEPEEVSKT